jgi:hypothetical protein
LVHLQAAGFNGRGRRTHPQSRGGELTVTIIKKSPAKVHPNVKLQPKVKIHPTAPKHKK